MFQMDMDKLTQDHFTTLLGTRQLGGEIPQLLTVRAKRLNLRKRIKKTNLPTSTEQGEVRRHSTMNTIRISQKSHEVSWSLVP